MTRTMRVPSRAQRRTSTSSSARSREKSPVAGRDQSPILAATPTTSAPPSRIAPAARSKAPSVISAIGTPSTVRSSSRFQPSSATAASWAARPGAASSPMPASGGRAVSSSGGTAHLLPPGAGRAQPLGLGEQPDRFDLHRERPGVGGALGVAGVGGADELGQRVGGEGRAGGFPAGGLHPQLGGVVGRAARVVAGEDGLVELQPDAPLADRGGQVGVDLGAHPAVVGQG